MGHHRVNGANTVEPVGKQDSDHSRGWKVPCMAHVISSTAVKRGPWRTRVLLILALVALLTLLGLYLREGVSIDACLDRGGSYNYRLAECDFNDMHPYAPFLERHVLITMFGLVLVLALSGCGLLVPCHRAPSDGS